MSARMGSATLAVDGHPSLAMRERSRKEWGGSTVSTQAVRSTRHVVAPVYDHRSIERSSIES